LRTDVPPTHPLAFVVDHVVPLALGGSDEILNLRPAHSRCNLRKGARRYLERQGEPGPPTRRQDEPGDPGPSRVW